MKKITKSSFVYLASLLLVICLVQAEPSVTNLDIASYTQGSNADSLQGKVKVNGQDYQVICDCFDENKQDQKNLLGPACDPSQLKLNQDKKGEGASFNDIRELVGHPSELKYGNVAETPFHCLDGRITTPVLGTLGGDAGEFILALQVYAILLGNGHEVQLNQEEVTSHLSEYLKYMKSPSFIMCTDYGALDHLQKELLVEGLDLFNPRPQLQKDLLEALVKPENIGDSHIRMLIKYAERYPINADIVRKFIVAFYTILWDKKNEFSKKLQLVMLVGVHQESAMLEVKSNEACTKAQLAPLLTPKQGKDGLSVLINHLDAASIKRIELSKFFSLYIAHHQEGFNPEIFYNRTNHHGYSYLEVTGSFLAKHLPFYTINIL